MAEPAAVLQLQVEAGRAAEPGHGGRHEHVDLAVADLLRQRPGRPLGDRRCTVLSPWSVLPVGEVDERLAEVLPVAAEVEAGDGEQGLDVPLLVAQQVVLDLLADGDGPRLGGAGRQRVEADHRALVLDGQEGAGQAHEQPDQGDDQHRVEDQRRQRATDHAAERRLVAAHGGGERSVEPAEEAAGVLAMALFDGFEQVGAERRRQDQRHQDRQGHRRDDGDRELAVDDAGRAADEGHRQEHRRQHQRDADQRAGDLAHRTDRRLLRRQSLLAHDPLDVLDHNDGVVDQKADRQHHGEHGQRVDRIAERGEHAEGPEQNDRHRDGGDQRDPPILQEHEHHRDDEGDGLDQRDDHLLNRELDEGRRVPPESSASAQAAGSRRAARPSA